LKSAWTFRCRPSTAPRDSHVARGDKPCYKRRLSFINAAGTLPSRPRHADSELAPGLGTDRRCPRIADENDHGRFFIVRRTTTRFDPKNWSGTFVRAQPRSRSGSGAMAFANPIQDRKALTDYALWGRLSPRTKAAPLPPGSSSVTFESLDPSGTPCGQKTGVWRMRLIVVTRPRLRPRQNGPNSDRDSHMGSGEGSGQRYVTANCRAPPNRFPENVHLDLSRGAIRLAVNYIGLMDEVAVFNRPLTAKGSGGHFARAS